MTPSNKPHPPPTSTQILTHSTRFPEIDPDNTLDPSLRATRSTNQGIAVASYNLGCFLGAVATIWLGNALGRRRVIFLGTAIMVVGAVMQAASFSLAHLVAGRILTGVGNGLNTSTVPTWQAETAAAHRRGRLVMVEGALITGGIMASNWIDLGCSVGLAGSSAAWRLPLAFQCFFCLLILLFVCGLPESPRWLVMRGRDAEAAAVLAVLADAPAADAGVAHEFAAIKAAVAEQAKGSFRDVFRMNKDR